MDQAIINYAVYEDAKEFLGIASATLPDITYLTQQIQGSGISGNIEAVLAGYVDAMSLTLNFNSVSDTSIRLSEPRRHQIDLRIAQQDEDPVSGELSVKAYKHVFVIVPKSDKGGNVAPASLANNSGEYAVRSWATYLDGELVRDIDPINSKCFINGVDYCAPVRNALGK